jgi:hypothetical protein
MQTPRWRTPILCDPRFDVTGAAVHDVPARFPVPKRVLNGPSQDESPSLYLVNLTGSIEAASMTKPLAFAFRKVASLATYINNHADKSNFPRTGLAATNMIGPAAHACLSIPRLQSHPVIDGIHPCQSPDLLVQEMLRLALLILIARLKKSFGLLSVEMELYYIKLVNLVPKLDKVNLLPQLRIWALVVVASIMEKPLTQQYTRQICTAMTKLNLFCGLQAVEFSRRIAWINMICDTGVPRIISEINR